MPTLNQLVRQGRADRMYKSKAPALQKGFNSHRQVLAPEERRVHEGLHHDAEEAELRYA